ncbi:MAG: hypothetical protein ACPGQS_03660 [Bradymonadia bacterium]
MKTNQRLSWKHLLLVGLTGFSFGCGDASTEPSEEPLRAIGSSTDNSASSSEQDYTDEGVPIVSTDQDNQHSQDAQTTTGQLNCLGVFDCFNTCAPEDQACVDACAERGTPQARQQLDALALCMQDNQCNDNACVEAHCSVQLDACGFNQSQNTDANASSQPSGSQSLDCQGIYTCFNECSDGDRACLDDCFNRGTSAAQAQVNAIGECAQTNECRDGNCVELNCPDQVAACDGGGSSSNDEPPSSAGTLSCSEIFECYGQCARGNQRCLDDCERNGTLRAQAQVNAIGSCIEQNDCQDSGCVDRLCASEVAACNDETNSVQNTGESPGEVDGSEGDLSCNQVFECFGRCTEGDRACLDECYSSGTADAQDAVSGIGNCVQANQCEDDACVAVRCPDEVSACNAQDAPSSSGSSGDTSPLNCTDIYDCFGHCAHSDTQCREACYMRGTAPAQAQVSAIRECIERENCLDDACVERVCYDDLTACGFEIERPVSPGSNDTPVGEPSTDNEPLEDQSNLPENGGVCDSATALSWGTQTGTTINAASSFQGTCSGQGAEVVYALTVESDTVVCLDTFDSDYDTALYVTANTCGGQSNEVACNDDTYGIQSQVLFSAEAGVTYYVFVDSYNVSGNFNLTATRGACRDRFGF